jgi:hypothetical protein
LRIFASCRNRKGHGRAKAAPLFAATLAPSSSEVEALMDRKRMIATLVVTAAMAVLTGHLMQNVTAPDHPARNLSIASITRQAPTVSPARLAPQPLPEIPPATVTPLAASVEMDPAAPELAAAFPDSLPETLPDPFPPISRMALASIIEDQADAAADTPGIISTESRGEDCSAVLWLAPAPAAMIDIAFDAPCHPGARAVVRHGGLAITGLISPDGALDLSLPALSTEAEVTIAVRGGPTVRQSVAIPDAADYDRVAIQWMGEDSFELHAFEFGARFGDPGHVSAASPYGPNRALAAEGGFLTALGDDRVDLPLLAEIYTFPVAHSRRGGEIDFAIEAAITPQTCGREMLGESLEMRDGAPVVVNEVSLQMPGCEDPSGFLVLNNLLSGLTIAGN